MARINREAEGRLDAALLRKLLRYDPETGEFWRVAVQPSGKISLLKKRAGCRRPNGRMFIKVGRRAYAAPRLAWLYMTDEWPADEVDHRDTDVTNDRWENLRLATSSQNQWNRSIRRDSRSGEKCIKRTRDGKRWLVRVSKDGYRIVKYFPTIDAAREARDALLSAMHGEYARRA